MTPSAILSHALKDCDAVACGRMARELGIPIAAVTRAKHGARGQPTRCDYHIMLCAWLGIDPITGADTGSKGTVIAFDARLFAIGARINRYGKQDGITAAAKSAGISRTVLHRIETGKHYSFDSAIRAARYTGLDLRGYSVSRETGTRNEPNSTARSAA